MTGDEIHGLARKLWPLNRSLTGDGLRETLAVIKHDYLPDLVIHEVPSGTQAFDWVVPSEWKVNEAYIVDPSGNRICDFHRNNLHLVGYSAPVRQSMTRTELDKHLHSLPAQPTAVPYITSYYARYWGFCLSQDQRDSLPEGTYEVVVDSQLFDGSLTYADIVIKGDSEEEVLLSTYVCHPSMANNELSGVTVTTHLARWLLMQPRLRYTYRIVFIPETIGSIVYLSRHRDWLRKHVIAGFNISCVGDDRAYSFLPSRNGNTLSDQVARHVLKGIDPDFVSYRWADRGSDERQYCAPGIDLPIASIMRTKYGRYPEYHTSLDNLDHVVTPKGLQGGYDAIRAAIEAIERNIFPQATVLCEPQLGKRGLYPTLSTKASRQDIQLMMDLITWSDGTRSLIDIAEICEVPVSELYPIVDRLQDAGLLVSTRQ